MQMIYYADLLQTKSGHIFTSCGNFAGQKIRARLAYYQDNSSPGPHIQIQGKTYIKATYEQDFTIPHFKKLLNIPGEQHFEIDRSDIKQLFPAQAAKDGLTSQELAAYERLAGLFDANCVVPVEGQGLTGSGAVHAIRSNSDYDWVLQTKDLGRIKDFVTQEPRFMRDLPFTMEHVYRKYSHVKGLSREDLDRLFAGRWKYFRFDHRQVSLNFVDPTARADIFLDMKVSTQTITARGVVEDGAGSYYSPRIIPVKVDGQIYQLFTWMFLYNGAFKASDRVAFSGRLSTCDGKTYVLVESSEEYIKHVV